MYNIIGHCGLNTNADMTIFLVLLSTDYHRDIKITKNNATFSLLLALALSELKS
jgi:hypothetical protein